MMGAATEKARLPRFSFVLVHQWQRRSGKKDGVVQTCKEKERRERAVKRRSMHQHQERDEDTKSGERLV